MFIRVLKALFVLPLAPMVLLGCVGTPDGVRPVQGFELDRYLGTWYEIARYDAPFQEGCTATTATYSLRDDGLIRVVGREDDVKSKLEAHAYPREVEFIRQMPMTKTGKILKNKLKEL